jgi:hypothetical protein
MSNRKTILDALIGGPATKEELADACPKLEGRKLIDTINDCKKVGLIRLEKDVTGLPAYRLTPAGQGWLRANPGAAKPQPGVGKKTPAVPASQPIVDGGQHDADSAPMAGTVVEQPAQDESLVPAGSDENEAGNLRFMLAMIEAAIKPEPNEGIVLAIKRLQDRAEQAERTLESILSANRKFCGWVSEQVGGTKYPVNLYECQNILGEMIDGLMEDRERLEEEVTRAIRQRETWREIAEQYGHERRWTSLATSVSRANDIASLEGNASLPLEIAPKTPSTAVVKESLTTQPDETASREFNHYFRDVRHLSAIDIYRVLDLFDVTDHSAGHAIKKLIAAGKRGAKDAERDYIEAAKSIARKLEMMREDSMKAEALARVSA